MTQVPPLITESGEFKQMAAASHTVHPDLLATGTRDGTKFLRDDGTWQSATGTLSDGDKGDIVVSGSGTAWAFDSAVVTAFARTVLDDTSATAFRTTLGVGTGDSPFFTGLRVSTTLGADIRITDTGVTNADWSILPQTNNTTPLFRIYNRTLSKDVAYLDVTGKLVLGIVAAGALGSVEVDGNNTRIAWGTDGTGYNLNFAKNVAGAYTTVATLNDNGTFTATALTATAAVTGASVVSSGSVTDSKGDVRLIPQNSKSAAYTTVLADAGKHIFHPSADTTARTFTIDSNANVAYTIGTAITFVNQNGAGVVTIAITSDTMRLAGPGTTGSRTLAANGIATALKITSTEWIISGTGLT